MVMRLYNWEPLTLDHHAVNFGGFRHCGRGDKMISICHVLSNDHIFEGLSDLTGERPL